MSFKSVSQLSRFIGFCQTLKLQDISKLIKLNQYIFIIQDSLEFELGTLKENLNHFFLCVMGAIIFFMQVDFHSEGVFHFFKEDFIFLL